METTITQTEIPLDKEHQPEILEKVKELSKRVANASYLPGPDKAWLKKAAEYFQTQMPKPQGLLDPGLLINRYLVLSCDSPSSGFHSGTITLVSSHPNQGHAVEVKLTKDEAERCARLLLDAVEYIARGRNLATVNDLVRSLERK